MKDTQHLKDNKWTALGGFPIEERNFMRRNWKDLEYKEEYNGGWVRCEHVKLDLWVIYRYSPGLSIRSREEIEIKILELKGLLNNSGAFGCSIRYYRNALAWVLGNRSEL